MKFKDVTKDVRKKLKEEYEIIEEELNFFERGKGKIYAYKFEVPEFLKKYLVHSGVYFGRIEKCGLRLSIDGCSLVGKKAKNCVVEVEKEKVEEWMCGKDIDCNYIKEESKCRYLLLKWKSFFVGCGGIIKNGSKLKLKNYVPKNRRTKY